MSCFSGMKLAPMSVTVKKGTGFVVTVTDGRTRGRGQGCELWMSYIRKGWEGDAVYFPHRILSVQGASGVERELECYECYCDGLMGSLMGVQERGRRFSACCQLSSFVCLFPNFQILHSIPLFYLLLSPREKDTIYLTLPYLTLPLCQYFVRPSVLQLALFLPYFHSYPILLCLFFTFLSFPFLPTLHHTTPHHTIVFRT